MAELNLFHYYPSESLIHRMDPRFKLGALIIFSITIGLANDLADFLIISGGLAIILMIARLPARRLIQELKYLGLLILMVLVAQGTSVPGQAMSATIPWITREGLWSGLFFGWKLVLLVILGVMFTGTTQLARLRDALEWLLRPIPGIPETRVATMVSLTFSLVPLVFDQAAEMREAQQARCIGSRRNIIKRIRYLVLPLMTKTLLRAEEMAVAMEARCYSENRTPIQFKATRKDWVLLIMVGLVNLMILL